MASPGYAQKRSAMKSNINQMDKKQKAQETKPKATKQAYTPEKKEVSAPKREKPMVAPKVTTPDIAPVSAPGKQQVMGQFEQSMDKTKDYPDVSQEEQSKVLQEEKQGKAKQMEQPRREVAPRQRTEPPAEDSYARFKRQYKSPRQDAIQRRMGRFGGS